MRRKDFLQFSGLLGMGSLLSAFRLGDNSISKTSPIADRIRTKGIDGSAFDLKADPIPKVRIALAGLGNRGTSLIDMLSWLVKEGHAEITAISDINPNKVQKTLEKIRSFQTNVPATFTGSDEAWKDAFRPEVADLALICTPWEWHTPMALHAMRNGIHAASEVPIAYTPDDCLELIRTSEETKQHCI
ncbi:MAG: Gfo/Idh/MocA family oxidoreductase, partial [Flavobacteriales bacterium]|nr:Gfo/Idh/MocA family oxidoreductase [Flavobacteriales bacterium]